MLFGLDGLSVIFSDLDVVKYLPMKLKMGGVRGGRVGVIFSFYYFVFVCFGFFNEPLLLMNV